MENTQKTQDLDLAVIIAAKITERLEMNFSVMPTLTLAQTAEALGISQEKTRQLCDRGEIPFIRMDRLYRIKPADINAYLEKNYHREKNKK